MKQDTHTCTSVPCRKTRLGILTGCSYTSPKLYARTLVENLSPEEFEITLIAIDKPAFTLPSHVRLVELNPELTTERRDEWAKRLESTKGSQDPAMRGKGVIRKMWQRLAPASFRAIAGHLREGRRLAARIRGLPIDLLHANQFGGDPAVLAARLAGYRVVTTLHISTMADKFETTPLLASRVINLLTVLCSRRLIAVSQAMARDWSRYTLGRKDRFAVVHHGLRLGGAVPVVARRKDCAVRFGTAAMLHPKKGQKYLVEAFSRLAGEYPEVELVIAGDGGEGRNLREMARALPHSDRIRFLGFVTDMESFYRGIDVFVLPSLTEPFGYVLIEAMAGSLPVIASHVEAIPEIVVHEETGLLVPPADTTALCEAMERLVMSPESRRQMGARGRQRVQEHFTVEAMIAGTAEAYQAVDTRRLPIPVRMPPGTAATTQ